MRRDLTTNATHGLHCGAYLHCKQSANCSKLLYPSEALKAWDGCWNCAQEEKRKSNKVERHYLTCPKPDEASQCPWEEISTQTWTVPWNKNECNFHVLLDNVIVMLDHCFVLIRGSGFVRPKQVQRYVTKLNVILLISIGVKIIRSK